MSCAPNEHSVTWKRQSKVLPFENEVSHQEAAIVKDVHSCSGKVVVHPPKNEKQKLEGKHSIFWIGRVFNTPQRGTGDLLCTDVMDGHYLITHLCH